METEYAANHPEFVISPGTVLEGLHKEDGLMEIVQVVEKDSYSESDNVTLDVAEIVRDDFLAQNSFTTYNLYSPLYKSVLIQRNSMHFFNLANTVI